ncbi:MAG: TetR/AcrR family transcriptional regulator, transcriptional repressor for nem operon [Actinomycetota bacterium]
MPRRRPHSDVELATAAKHVFWERGFEGTAIDHLQEATGLSRSSLYLAFDTKRAIFDAALAEYVTTFVDPRIGPMEAPTAGLREVIAFFRGLAEYFAGPDGVRGCLYVNAIAELGRDPAFTATAAELPTRLRAAFSNALGRAADDGELDHNQVRRRAEMLTASTLGVWLAVRTDAAQASETCRAIAQEIAAWK